MIVLILGIIVFFGIHMLPAFRLNTALTTRFGEKPYKLGFSLASFLGLGLMIYGFQLAPFKPLWTPIEGARMATISVMPLVVILMCAADAPNNIKRWVRHPMLIGITIWGAFHLAANGDLASTLLFAAFAIFSILDIILVESSGRYKAKDKVSVGWDFGVVTAGFVIYGLLLYFHGSYTGMPLI